MYSINLRYGKKDCKIQINGVIETEPFGQLLKKVFFLTEDVIGISDVYGKFYDLAYAAKNLKSIQQHILTLVTSKELKSSNNVSFGSHQSGNKSNQIYGEKCLGIISDLAFFQQNMVQNKLSVVISHNNQIPSNLVQIPFFIHNHCLNSIKVYKDKKIILNLNVYNWQLVIKLLNNFFFKYQSDKSQKIKTESAIQQRQKRDHIYRQILLQIFEDLNQEDIISELELYKYKVKLIQNPQSFIDKYVGRSNKDKNELLQIVRNDALKRKEQLKAYQAIINIPHDPIQNISHAIPIVVRKHNNQVETVTATSHFKRPKRQ